MYLNNFSSQVTIIPTEHLNVSAACTTMDLPTKYAELLGEIEQFKNNMPNNQTVANVAGIKELLEKCELLFDKFAGDINIFLVDLEVISELSKMLVQALAEL